MKHERAAAIVLSALLAFFTAWGATGCFLSAFNLPLVSPSAAVILCGGTALLSALLLSFPRGGLVLLCLWALACGYIWHDGAAFRQFWQLLHQISIVYDRAYGCGVLILPEGLANAAGFDWPAGIWAALMAGAVCWSVCRQISVWLPMTVTLLPLGACIVVTDTVPDESWLLMVMTCLILLLLTASARREHPLQGLRLTAAAALPVGLALTILFLLVPQDRYVNHATQLRETIIEAMQALPRQAEARLTQLAREFQPYPLKQVDLASLGPRIPLTYPVMTVTAEENGPLYLRGQDYDLYTGFGWTSSGDRREEFFLTGPSAGVVAVQLETRKTFQYLPYYPAAAVPLLDGSAQNPGRSLEYVIRRSALPDNWRETAYRSGPSDDWPDYRILPEQTRQAAAAMLQGLTEDAMSHTEKADIIAAFVTGAADYDLNPDKMPADAPDFALWFLQEGEKGYCIHFATAATVLLRAAQVPARYVTGYLLEAQAGLPVAVTEESAHAWAEYYEPALGIWIPLDATPASESSAAETIPQAGTAEPMVPSQPEPAPRETLPETVPQTTVLPEVPLPSLSAPDPDAADPSSALQRNYPWAAAFLWILLSFLMLTGLRNGRLLLRRRRHRAGTANQQALSRWQETVLLSRLLKETPNAELMELAQKARFSQHTLSPEELARFDSFNRSCLRRLRELPWYWRLIHQYVYAAY